MDDVTKRMYSELGMLARTMEAAVRDCRVIDVPLATTTAQLPKATEHLSDLTRLTEEGTHKVMELTERIQENHRKAANILESLQACLLPAGTDGHAELNGVKTLLAADDHHLLDIITALSFQDLVGQRINKIVTILDEVEHKLLEMVVIFGVQQQPGHNGTEARAEEMLKQLEASKTTALKQDLVDDILSEFGFDK